MTMSAEKRPNSPFDVEARVRGNVGSVGIAAGLLIFFGFFYIARPVGDGVGGYGALTLYFTLRLGGLAMAGIAVWCSLGHPLALFFDAVVSGLIGLSLVVSGVLMVVGGWGLLQPIISVICGALFISAGWRNGRDFLRFPCGEDREQAEAADEIASSFFEGAEDGGLDDSTDSLPERLLRRAPEAEESPRPRSDETASSPPRPRRKPGGGRKPQAPPPPEGFLANLGDDDPIQGR
jgi:hypothetical protein